MTKGVETIFTYEQFEKSIRTIIVMARQEHYLELATGSNFSDTPVDKYIELLSSIIPSNADTYDGAFYAFWESWDSLVTVAIVSFVYGVVDYTGKGDIVAPYNHELLSLDSKDDPVYTNSKDYTMNIDSCQMLWRICTGEIPVRERFS